MTPTLTLHSRALLAEDRGEALLVGVGPDHLLVNNLLRELDCRHIEGHVTLALEVVLVADSKVVAIVVIGDLPNSSPPAVGSLDVLDIIHIVISLGEFFGSLSKLLGLKLTGLGVVGNGLTDVVDKKVPLGDGEQVVSILGRSHSGDICGSHDEKLVMAARVKKEIF